MILAEVLEAHRPYGLDCKCGVPINSDAGWVAHVRGVLRELLTVRSVEELDALPTYSLIRDIEDGTVWENHNGRWVWLIGPFHAQERKPLQHSAALVLYRPDWSTP